MTSQNVVNTGLGNDFLPDGTKSLPEPISILEGSFAGNDQDTDHCSGFENQTFQITFTFSMANNELYRT